MATVFMVMDGGWPEMRRTQAIEAAAAKTTGSWGGKGLGRKGMWLGFCGVWRGVAGK